ncbi:hypothetical protein [Culicoidibacter larvae]|uniref:Uncharacterized protein n=1 Tax=Culicoidibacter larvae TaxID=2579976 RepID=A0A5R8QEV7_9FIRM|nr:hypothetical protein [Culicoidibacter larvae]TLG74317.1 hypothetical protein FEZ08_06315 [Culicoidibacter larvae]
MYEEIIKNFISHGYIITLQVDSGYEAVHNDFTFSQMIEDNYYFESCLSLSNDELLLVYDILSGEYEEDFFTGKPNVELMKQYKERIQLEVGRLELSKYIGISPYVIESIL